MKRAIIFMLLCSLLLAGCRQVQPVEVISEEKAISSSESEGEQPNTFPAEKTESLSQEVIEESQTEESAESTDIPETTQPQTYYSEEQAESTAESAETVDKQTDIETPPATEDPPKQDSQDTLPIDEPSSQTVTESAESETEASSQPVTELELKPTDEEEPEQTQESEAESEAAEPFDIGSWVSFAQNYAQSIGLTLDAAAVDCWDNPITAGVHCIYLERDICNRLDRYNRDDDITDVWIWAVEAGDGCYDIYIGYA